MPPRKCVRPYTGFAPTPRGVAVLLLVAAGPWAQAEESHPGLGLEALYSQAALDYGKRNYAAALASLEKALARAPGDVKALELEALALRAKGDAGAAIEAYRRLLSLSRDTQAGAYHFQLATIYESQGDQDSARAEYGQAIAARFNVEAAHVALGLMSFGSGDSNGALEQFRGALEGGAQGDLRVLALYYVGAIHLQLGDVEEGLDALKLCVQAAYEAKGSASATDLFNAARRLIAPYESGQFYATITFFPQADSNVSLFPSGGGPNPLASGHGALKLNLLGSLGYASSLKSSVQWVLSDRLSINENIGPPEVAAYGFATTVPDLFLTFSPLSVWPVGLKFEGTFTSQNPTPRAGQPFVPLPTQFFSLSGEFGPYIKFRPGPRTQFELDLFYRPEAYAGAAGFDSSGYSGHSLLTRLTGKTETSSRWFNPGASFWLERDVARDYTLSYFSVAGELSNTFHLMTSHAIEISFDLAYFGYTSAANREDLNLNPHFSWIWTLNPHWSVMADVLYALSNSSNSAYGYSRLAGGLAVSWTL